MISPPDCICFKVTTSSLQTGNTGGSPLEFLPTLPSQLQSHLVLTRSTWFVSPLAKHVVPAYLITQVSAGEHAGI